MHYKISIPDMTLTTISSRGLIGLLTTQAVVPTTTTFFASKLSSLAQVVGGRQGKLLSTTKALLLTQLPHYNTRRNIRSSSFPSRPLSDQQRRAKNSAFFSSSIRSAPTMVQDWDMNLDPVQKKLLEEECIVLDKDDKVIGHDSKKNCHLIRNGDVLLHRAFSVFLFNTKGNNIFTWSVCGKLFSRLHNILFAPMPCFYGSADSNLYFYIV